MKLESRIEFGQKVRDTVSGFEGIAECISAWRFGCVRIGIRPQKLDEKGLPFEPIFFDEPQVEVIEETKDKLAKEAHGPRMDERRNRNEI